MKLSAVLTVYARPLEVLGQVFDSLKEQDHDELVIVFDRSPIHIADFCSDYWASDKRTVWASQGEGAEGWRSPVKAWNAGFNRATGDVLYGLSSETIQAAGNVARVRQILEAMPEVAVHGKVECSCGPEGREVEWAGTAPGNLFGDAAHPRPLGFIWAAPRRHVHQIGGYDTAFDSGFWFDDGDFWLRLWRTGLDFVFDDSISGIHQHHERPVLTTPEGQEGIRKNREYMLWKHGILAPWGENLPRTEERKPGRTVWRHL